MDNKVIAKEIAEDFVENCCIDKIRTPSGNFRRVLDDEKLTKRLTQRIRTILNRHTLHRPGDESLPTTEDVE